MKHLKPSFSIQAHKIDFNTAQVYTEIGPMGFSMAVADGEKCFKAVVIYNFPAGLREHEYVEKLNEVFNSENLLQKKYSKAHIFWSFPESMLMPAAFMEAEKNESVLNLVFGDAKQGIVRSDFIYKHNLHLVYRTATAVVETVADLLPMATQTHFFSTLVNRDFLDGDHLYCVFYNNCLTVLLIGNGKLQVVQNYGFNNPADAVFHLLNTCKGFNVKADEVCLHINGMIDKESELFAAIYKYFLHIEFDRLPEGFNFHESIKHHPEHFFSHLFELASCV